MLLKSSAYSVAGSVIQFVVSLGSGMLIARTLGPEGKGVVYLVVQYATLGGLVLSFGLGSSYLYYLRKGVISSSEIIAHALLALSLVSGLCLGTYVIGRPLLDRLTGGTLDGRQLALLLALLVLNISSLFSGSIVMNERAGVQKASVLGMLGGLGYISALLIGLVWLRLGTIGAIIATLAPPIIRLCLAVGLLARSELAPLTFRGLGWTKMLLIYGLGSFFGNVMMTTACRVDSFIINSFLGPAPLGVYSVAVSLAELTLMIPAAVGVALFPHLTGQSEVDRVETISLIARLSLCLGVASAFALGIGAYPVIALVFGARFLPAYWPLLALLPGLIAMTTAYGYTNYFSSIGRPLVNAAVFGVGLAVNVALNLLVVPRFGIVGAAAVTSFSYSVSMVLCIVIISRMAHVPWSSLVIPRRADVELMWDKVRALGFRLRRAPSGVSSSV